MVQQLFNTNFYKFLFYVYVVHQRDNLLLNQPMNTSLNIIICTYRPLKFSQIMQTLYMTFEHQYYGLVVEGGDSMFAL